MRVYLCYCSVRVHLRFCASQGNVPQLHRVGAEEPVPRHPSYHMFIYILPGVNVADHAESHHAWIHVRAGIPKLGQGLLLHAASRPVVRVHRFTHFIPTVKVPLQGSHTRAN